MNTTMNTMQIAEIIPQQNDAASTANAKRERSNAPNPLACVRLRHGALLGLVLALVWFAVTVHNYINAIEAEMDMIRADLLVR